MIENIYSLVEKAWDKDIEPAMKDFVRLPALSVDFDKDWEEHGLLLQAVNQAKAWAEKLGINGLSCTVIKDDGFAPCLLVQIEGTRKTEKSVFLYGHLDKQPPNTGWDENKSAWEPVIENNRLYGRGSADDGYSFYTSLGTIKALQEAGISLPRCVGLFETCEESGSVHYEEYLKECADVIGDIGLVVALDSSCGDYDRLWITKSLRGMIGGALKVQVLNHGVHSGEASGIVPSSFMILRSLLDRVENSRTGEISDPAFNVKITDEIIEQSKQVAQIMGDTIWKQFPFTENTQPRTKDLLELLINRNWKPELTITGMDGIPSVADGGNVMRMYTTAKIGIRLPPGVDAKKAAKAFAELTTKNVPYQAKVDYRSVVASDGWVAPGEKDWLKNAFEHCSEKLWGNKPCYLGMGASIPLLNVFSGVWPSAQFMVAGVLGPGSNAHGPNEFLDINYVKKLASTVGYVIANYAD